MTTTAGPRLRPATDRRRITTDPARLIEAVALLYLEVEAGRRPLAQLRGVLSPSVHRRLAARCGRTLRGRGAGPAKDAIRCIHICRPKAEAVEASVVATVGGRIRALAIRVELHCGRWRVVELACPEDGDEPRRTASLRERTPKPDAFDQVLGA